MPSVEGDFAPDPRCAPAKPSLQWHRISGNKLEPRENQGGDSIALKRDRKEARKRDRKSICKERMHELLGLGGITVSTFKKGTERRPEKETEKN